ncbi:MAG: hypothetical protein HY744_26675 [Deltaproteobacteria bacterium]|nr:hypothetical protein [Deltaproteobacteria bacterium]
MVRRVRWMALLGCLGLVLLVSAAPAFAQQGPSAADRAAAQALFDEARDLKGKERYEEACPKFEESYRLDPAIGTQGNLADCYEKIGKTASAWIHYLEVAAASSKAGQEDRAKIAKERAAGLEPKLSRLRIAVRGAVQGLEVKRNGVMVRQALWGTAVPVDPGTYEITAAAPGRKPWHDTVTVGADADRQEITVPALEVGGEEPAGPGPVGPPVEPGGPGPKPGPFLGDEPAPETSDGTSLKIVGLIAGGVGLAGVGVGVYFAVDSYAKYQDSLKYCTGKEPSLKCYETPVCPKGIYPCPGMTLQRQSQDAKTAALVLIPIGGAMTITGAILSIMGFVQAGGASSTSAAQEPSKNEEEEEEKRPSDSEEDISRLSVLPWLAPSEAGLTLTGSF